MYKGDTGLQRFLQLQFLVTNFTKFLINFDFVQGVFELNIFVITHNCSKVNFCARTLVTSCIKYILFYK